MDVEVTCIILWKNRTWNRDTVRITSRHNREDDILAAQSALSELNKHSGKDLYMVGPCIDYREVG